ncbi:phosphopantetheine-binding protein [Tumebacillus permanentifrigoris]|uniref:Acyl carrier protein n=1 Tax=Tumebacillus permanentifrigoris TaxID=378543 RepID=A0A316D6S1_9BACL|nr:phosphopantetheine-binding protein [Tumebacillus permanentifrigoris]PWK08992.1 acyl carrier protein [Tumebacillus permanentifrigoris]
MESVKTLELRVKQCIINRLGLDVSADEIEDDAPLFGEGLGLDSIDALELVIAIGKEFDVAIGDDDMGIFQSVNRICEFIRTARPEL